MTIVRTARHRGVRTRRLAAGTAGLLGLTVLAACSGTPGLGGGDEGGSNGASASEADVPAVNVQANVRRNAQSVPVDRMVRLSAKNGTFKAVKVRGGKQVVRGSKAKDSTVWKAAGRLEPGREYTVQATTVDQAGEESPFRTRFRTADLSLDQQTYASIAPLGGETVGVGMPVIVNFDVPVTNKKAIERHLSVQSSPQQPGAWHWLSDNEVHWRPKKYWKSGTDVTVKADVNSVPAGNGVFGQKNRQASFTVGQSVVHKINLDTHQMRSFINGKLVRTTPITGGKPGFETRSGTKVIIEKFAEKNMDAATTGISEGDAEYYDIEDVPYAMRVTYSGEFLHGAPWSVGSQGAANVSHGCVGMSVENAHWLYDHTNRGDVVETTGTSEQMTLENGYGDWTLPFKQYKQGSALS